MANITNDQIKKILEESSTTFHKAPAEASSLDAITLYLYERSAGDAKTAIRKLFDAFSDTYNAAIEEGFIVGFRTALEILGTEPEEDQIKKYLANN